MLLTTGLIVLEVSLCSKYPIPNTCLLYCVLYCIVSYIVSNRWRYLDPQQCCWPPSSLCWSSWLSTCQCRDEENYNQRYHNIPINFSFRARVQKEEHQIFEKTEGCNHLESLNGREVLQREWFQCSPSTSLVKTKGWCSLTRWGEEWSRERGEKQYRERGEGVSTEAERQMACCANTSLLCNLMQCVSSHTFARLCWDKLRRRYELHGSNQIY